MNEDFNDAALSEMDNAHLRGVISLLKLRLTETPRIEVPGREPATNIEPTHRLIREAYDEGLKEGVKIQRQIIVHAEPYEIQTEAAVKYSAKGEMQPEASCKIIRHLEDGNQISELIRADLKRGVEEIMTAIEAQRKRNTEMK